MAVVCARHAIGNCHVALLLLDAEEVGRPRHRHILTQQSPRNHSTANPASPSPSPPPPPPPPLPPPHTPLLSIAALAWWNARMLISVYVHVPRFTSPMAACERSVMKGTSMVSQSGDPLPKCRGSCVSCVKPLAGGVSRIHSHAANTMDGPQIPTPPPPPPPPHPRPPPTPLRSPSLSPIHPPPAPHPTPRALRVLTWRSPTWSRRK